jgi:aspartyl-tRNA(Asn)/glutamyl-tRNA(Gln) amidotransferase subunit B
VERALAYEVARQREVLARGEAVVQETRHWDERRGVTFASRTKEEAEDYRYFPEPDLVPVEVTPQWLEEVRRSLPELPDARRDRIMAQYGLGRYDAELLVQTRATADFFEAAVAAHPSPKAIANWMLGEVSAYLNEHNLEIDQLRITPRQLAELVRLVEDGTISGRIAKDVIAQMLQTGEDPRAIVERQGLVQIADEAALRQTVEAVIRDHPEPVRDVQAGKEKAIAFLVGQVMRRTQGRANPALVQRLLRELLGLPLGR